MLEAWRRAYGCDCCGPVEPDPHDRIGKPVRVHLKLIERVTGFRPPTCPWRAFYDPLVQEAIKLAHFAAKGNLVAGWGDDPEQILVDAFFIYDQAKERTLAEDVKIQRQKDQREAEIQKSKGQAMARSFKFRNR